MVNISACIIVKDSETTIERCLQSLHKHQEIEIIVVDTGSSDNTKSIAQKYTNHIYDFKWCDDFSAARNFAVSKAYSDNILIVDSDEYISKADIEELVKLIHNNHNKVGRVLLKNVFTKDTTKSDCIEYLSRVFNRKYYKYSGRIHEQLVSMDENPIETYMAPIELIHTGYDLDSAEIENKTRRNIELLISELKGLEQGESTKKPYILYQLGKSYYLKKDYNTAAQYFSEALYYDLNPQLDYVIDLVETYGYALINSGQAEKALGFEGIYDVFGDTADFNFLMGMIYMNNERFDEAISQFLKATQYTFCRVVGVNSYLAYYNVGVIYECLGHKSEALKYYRKCEDYKAANDRILALTKLAIVIVSYNNKRLMQGCIESIRNNTEDKNYRIIVVDNASNDGICEWLETQKDIVLVVNSENKGFPYACNQGIALSEDDEDILLLNNDTIVTPRALHWLQMGLYDSDNIGAVGAVSNNVANYQQVAKQYDTIDEWLHFAENNNVAMKSPYEAKGWLVGFAMLIKKRAIKDIILTENKVNQPIPEVLDVQFTPGNFEDNDLSIRLIKAGYKLLLCKNSFIYHYGGSSFNKNKKAYLQLLEKNQRKLAVKYGIDYVPYSYVESSLVDMIDKKEDDYFNVLEIGCRLGATLSSIAGKFYNSNIVGIENNSKISKLTKNIVPLIDDSMISNNKFDYIILDRIMSSENVDSILNSAVSGLKEDGMLLVNVYNTQCIRTQENGMSLNEVAVKFNEYGLSIQTISYKNIICSDEERDKVNKLMEDYGDENKPLYEASNFIFSAKLQVMHL